MGEHIDGLALFLPRGNVLDDFQSVPADRPIDGHVFVGNLAGAAQRCVRTIAARPVTYGRQHFVECPFQIDRSRTRGNEDCTGLFQRFVRCIGPQGEPDTIGRGRTDQGRAADLHRLDRASGVFKGDKPQGGKAVGQLRLVDDARARTVAFDPDGPHLLAINFHG